MLASESFQRRLCESFDLYNAAFPYREEAKVPLQVLMVVAHPDDESECAAMVYRITHELGGAVDQAVVTNGEGGHQYSAPAQAFYGLAKGEEAWRKNLARIRRRELIQAGRILGVRDHYFFEQPDTGLTLDEGEGLRAWNIERVERGISELLTRNRYDLVIALLPAADTHGHHKTVALLTLAAVANLDEGNRPGVLGVRAARPGTASSERYHNLDGFHLTRAFSLEPDWTFDRQTPMRCHAALDYSIVVNWVIAAHKSQGAFQMEFARRTQECYWLFEISGAAGANRWRRMLRALEPDSRAEFKISEYSRLFLQQRQRSGEIIDISRNYRRHASSLQARHQLRGFYGQRQAQLG